jgi:hypothetical protein
MVVVRLRDHFTATRGPTARTCTVHHTPHIINTHHYVIATTTVASPNNKVSNSNGDRGVDGPPIVSLCSKNVVYEEEMQQAACSTLGAFVWTDHGLDPSLLENVLELGYEFVALPVDTKEKCNLQLCGAKWSGCMPLGGEE